MQEVDQLVLEVITRGIGGVRSDLRAIRSDIDTVEGRAERLDRVSDRLLGFGAAGAGAFALIGRASLKAKGEMQLAEIGFTKSLGSQRAALSKLQELRQFDRESPLDFRQSVKGAQRLLAVGFAADGLKSTMTDIGDATIGAGADVSEFMDIARALGQMKLKPKISMEEINQLADHNINALGILQKQLKLTDDQIADLAKGDLELKGSTAVDALLKGFRELYGGTMAEGAKTLPGQVSNLNSSLFQLGETVGGLEVSKAGSLIETLTGFADKTNEFTKQNPEIVKTGLALGGIGVAALITVGAVGKLAGVMNEGLTLYGRVRGAKDLLTKATKADSAAELAKAGIAGQEAQAIDTVSDAVQTAAGAKGKLAQRTLAGAVASATATRGTMDLAEATASFGKASNAAEQATTRLAKANSLRGRISEQLTKTETALEKVKKTKLPTDPLEVAAAEKRIAEEATRLEARRLSLRSRLGRVGSVANEAQSTLKSANASKFRALETMRGGLSKTADMSDLTSDAAKAKRLYDLNQTYEKTASKVESTTRRLSKAQAMRDKIAKQLARTEASIQKGARARKPMDADKSFRLGERRLKLMNRLSRVEELIERTQGALDAANAQKTLAKETISLAEKAAKATPKLGALAKIQRFLSEPIAPAMSRVPQLATKAFQDPITGELIDPKVWNAARMNAARSGAYTSGGLRMAETSLAGSRFAPVAKLFGGSGSAITGGAVAGAGVTGLIGAYSQHEDMKALGKSEAESLIAGGATGLTEAAIALFVPGGAVAVGLTEGIRLLINELINKPLEDPENNNSGLPDDVVNKWDTMTPQERQDAYFDESRKKQQEAQERGNSFWIRAQDSFVSRVTGTKNRRIQLEEEAYQAQMAGNQERRLAPIRQKAAEDFALNQRLDQFRKEHGVNKDYRFNRTSQQYELAVTPDELRQRGEDYKKASQDQRVRDAIAKGASLRNGELTVPNRVLQKDSGTARSDEDALLQDLQNRQATRPIYNQEPSSNSGYDVQAQQTGQVRERNGNTRTRIQVEVVQREGPGDRQARIAEYNTMTATPRFR